MNEYKKAPSEVFTTLIWTGQDTNLMDRKGDLEKIIEYYCDYGHLQNLLESGHHYVKGRRGTGKTALMVRAYAECLLSWGDSYSERPSKALNSERALGVYIDLQTATNSLTRNDQSTLELSFVETFLNKIIEHLESVWSPSPLKSKGYLVKALDALIKNGRVSSQKAKTLNEFKEVVKLLKTLTYLPSPMRIHKEGKTKNNQINSKLTFSALPIPSISGSIKKILEECSQSLEQGYPPTAAEILRMLDECRKNADISAIYVFLDEFSNIASRDKRDELYGLQKRLSRVLKNLFKGHHFYYKIAVITDRYTLGDLEPPHDISEISLDISDIFKRAENFKDGMKKIETLTERILDNRFKVFSPGTNKEDLFGIGKEKAISILSKASMGIPRTLGRILKEAYQGADNIIDEKSLEASIREDHKINQGLISNNFGNDRLYSESYYRMWKKMLKHANSIMTQYPNVPVSHFYVSSKYERYLRPFRENYLIHLIQKNFEPPGKKLGKRDFYNLYAFDYGALAHFSKNYDLPESDDAELWNQFNYDSIIVPYIAEEEETYRCDECGNTYLKKELPDNIVPFCDKHDKKMRLVIPSPKISPGIEGVILEIDIRILTFLKGKTKDNPVKAIEIAMNIDGCTYQKAAWFARKNPQWIERKKPISRRQRNPYIYFEKTG